MKTWRRTKAVSFHHWLDGIFQQQLAFSVFFRFWLAFGLVIAVAVGLSLYQLEQSIRPSAQRVVEDTLVDSSRLLAAVLSEQLNQQGYTDELPALSTTALAQAISHATLPADRWQQPLWFNQKQKSQFRVYITDRRGVVVYDSQGQAVGADYSRWNDVYLTLRGKYGARSTRGRLNDEQTSVMYVAAPILSPSKAVIGVVSIGKPVATLLPYLAASRHDLLMTLGSIAGISLLIAALMAGWLRHSIEAVNRYTQQLASTPPPHFYLAKELNELTCAITSMKHTIENKAYVTDYVHTLTHELKSPLTAIRACGELLADELPPPAREQFSQTITQQADKLQALIERLLIIAKLEQPTVRLHRQPLMPTAIIEACLTTQAARIAQRGLAIYCQIETDGLLNADKFWLEQCVQNLLDNAITFANHWLIVRLYRHDDRLIIEVINDSPPLPAYVLERAFERYFSVHLSHNDEPPQKGTGLGLTLVARVMALHGGQVTMTQQRLGQLITDVEPNIAPLTTLNAQLKNDNCICLRLVF